MINWHQNYKKLIYYFFNDILDTNRGEYMRNIITLAGDLGSGKTVEVKLNKIATMACKAAVKANDYLTQLEMEKLI